MHSILSHKSYDLHLAALYSCSVICILVFLALICSIIKFRRSNDIKANHFHKSLALEIFWATLPFIILIALALPMISVLWHK